MANATSILINVGAKTAGAVRDMNSVTRALQEQDEKSKSWGKNMLNAGNLAKAGFAAAGLAAVGVAASFVEFGKAAMEDEKQAKKLADTLGNVPGVTQKMVTANAAWIDSMELATNIADTDLRAAMSRLALVTGDVAEAQELVALAADVSVGRNISLAAATKLVEKAATGHTEALMKQMPWLDANKDGAISTKEAIDGLGNAYKDAATKAADNDPWKRLKTIWDQLKEALGQWLLPLLEDLSDWFKDPKNQRKVQEFIDKVATLSYEMGTKLVQAIKDFIAWLKSPEGKKAMQDFKDLATDIGDAIKWIMEWADKLKVLKWAFDLNPLRMLASMLSTIKDHIQWLKDNVPRLPRIPGLGSFSVTSVSPSSLAAAPTTSAAATPSRSERPVLVTEEQIYRAVQRLIVRGDARNGRAVRLA